jgi:hypothetical protein
MQSEVDPLAQLTEIRAIMERSSRFLSLSGLAGVGAGIVALAGAAAGHWWLDQHFGPGGYARLAGGTPEEQLAALPFLLELAGGMVIAGLLVAFIFTRRRAARTGQTLWSSAARRLALSLMAPLVAGGLFCLALYWHGAVVLVVPAMLLFYGLALLSASKYTLNEIRGLGYLQVGLGLTSLVAPGFGLAFFAAGFGLGHIGYGLLMFNRYERTPSPRS